MQRSQLSDMTVFVEVARANGFRAAAKNLKLKPGSVSEAVQRFEDRLGVRLFERSTRSVALTTIGEQLFARSLPAIDELEAAVQGIEEQKEKISGTLRLTAPYSAGAFFLDELVVRFAESCPEATVEVIYDDRKVDMMETRVDAAIRSSTLLEADTHAVPVGPKLKMAIVAAPAYLHRKGAPDVPQDILNHDGICFAFGSGGQLAPWTFEGEQGSYIAMPKPRMVANDLRSLLLYATNGLGLAYVYAEMATPFLAEGRLVEVLPGEVPSLPSYSLNYRSKKHMTRRLRAFIDLAKSKSR
ncbi:MAG: LysR family transcriptional regulator [Stappiaceae bacterium]